MTSDLTLGAWCYLAILCERLNKHALYPSCGRMYDTKNTNKVTDPKKPVNFKFVQWKFVSIIPHLSIVTHTLRSGSRMPHLMSCSIQHRHMMAIPAFPDWPGDLGYFVRYRRPKNVLYVYGPIGSLFITLNSYHPSSEGTQECLLLVSSSSLCWPLLAALHLHLASSHFSSPRGKASLLST